MPTARNMRELINTQWGWTGVPPLVVTVRILDVRTAYGRTECKITPLHGSGEKWVNVNTLEKEEPHE